MDATTRWETEAIRSVGAKRQSPPKPTRKRTRADFTDTRHWVTLREAEEATGIPTNTLRKWVRKADLPSYLEADGDLALRMVDLDAVVARAKELGREIVLPSGGTGEPASQGEMRAREHGVVRDAEPEAESPPSESPPGTMIVPIDAWNKMLNQLGNLHEAGQDLAVARERAAKAETEVSFLRERLAEMRAERKTDVERPRETDGTLETLEVVLTPAADTAEPESQPKLEAAESTTYWRYLTTGWRDRKRRR